MNLPWITDPDPHLEEISGKYIDKIKDQTKSNPNIALRTAGKMEEEMKGHRYLPGYIAALNIKIDLLIKKGDTKQVKTTVEAIVQFSLKREQAIEQTLKNVYHEAIKSLHSTMGLSQLLAQKHLFNEPEYSYLQAISSAGHQLLHILHDTFQVSGALTTGQGMEQEQTGDLVDQLQGIRVLLADGDKINLFTTTEMLRNFIPNIQLSIVHNGDELLRILKNHPHFFDVVLVDTKIPVINAFDAAFIAKNELKITAPIFGLASTAEKGEVEECYEVGMSEFLMKPFNPQDLLFKLAKYYTSKPSPVMISTQQADSQSIYRSMAQKNLQELRSTLLFALEKKDFTTIPPAAGKALYAAALLEYDELFNILKELEEREILNYPEKTKKLVRAALGYIESGEHY